MTPNEYQAEAARTLLTPSVAVTRLSDLPTLRLLHAALGCASESGELASAVEKYLFFGRDMDKPAVVAEIGDIMWYVALACTALDVPMETAMRGNVEKLRLRFPGAFSNEKSVSRNERAETDRVQDVMIDQLPTSL